MAASVRHCRQLSCKIASRRSYKARLHFCRPMASAGSKQLWAFDFDGVVCDSVGESSLTAWKAAARLWPDVMTSTEAQGQKDRVLRDMHTVRPVVETGFENVIQVRCLLEGVSTEDILHNWHTVLPEHMDRWDASRQQLLELFGSTRDEWMASDLPGWLQPNEIYPGMAEALKGALHQHETYIVTTKQARFTEALLRDKAQLDFPADRIFSTAETGQPKSDVLHMLQGREQGAACHFVEDKLGTLEKVCKVDALQHWQLYLVDWGYNTEQERAKASQNPRIQVVGRDEFQRALGA